MLSVELLLLTYGFFVVKYAVHQICARIFALAYIVMI